MYFLIIGKNQEISLEELKNIKINNLHQTIKWLYIFELEDDNQIQKLNTLWWIIKRGIIKTKDEIKDEIKKRNIKIMWVKDKEIGIKLKKEIGIKRFKITKTNHTDKEIQEKWIEIIKIQDKLGIVYGYQNIKIYEKIDFEKPSRSMKMGMMPAKLTHIMINIWIWLIDNIDKDTTIYDPFVGSWTTWFLSNYLWYNFIWSDIDISHISENKKRWNRDKNEDKKNKQIEYFQQDITKQINKGLLTSKNIIIVSEWWLWPIVTEKTKPQDIINFKRQVSKLYLEFINNISKSLWNIPCVFTIPRYININEQIEESVLSEAKKLGRKNSYAINEIYKREKQKVGRKIIILK